VAVRIRLTRVGATKRPAYRVIAIDRRRSRDGRALEILGFYDPLTEPATVQLQSERISEWIGKGAQPSDTVVRLMRQAEKEAASPPTEKPKRPARPKAASASTKPKASRSKAAAAPAAEEPAAEGATAPASGASAGDATETAPSGEPADARSEAGTSPSADAAAEGAADSAVEPAVSEEAEADPETPAPDGQVEERDA
jgi:small subunit ribosomal protein S16